MSERASEDEMKVPSYSSAFLLSLSANTIRVVCNLRIQQCNVYTHTRRRLLGFLFQSPGESGEKQTPVKEVSKSFLFSAVATCGAL